MFSRHHPCGNAGRHQRLFAGMTAREKDAATGAVLGGVAGNVVGGGVLGTAAGAAVGGDIGHEVTQPK